MTKKKHIAKKKSNSHGHHDSTVTYVKIDGPITIRKGVLQSAIFSTGLLRDYERYKATREQKVVRIKQLLDIFKEIENLFRRLRTSDLPVFDRIEQELKKSAIFREQMFAPPQKAKAAKPKKAKVSVVSPQEIVAPVKPQVKKETSPEEKLELDIRDIQDKLNSLEL